MYRFMNLPHRNSNFDIKGRVDENYFTIFNSDGWSMICEVGRITPEGTARDIADSIRLARNSGYEQCRSDFKGFLEPKRTIILNDYNSMTIAELQDKSKCGDEAAMLELGKRLVNVKIYDVL